MNLKSAFVFLFLPVFLIDGLKSIGQNSPNELSVENIKPELLESINAVIRFDICEIELHASGSAVIDQKFAVTVLNDKGKNYGRFFEYSNAGRRIKNIKGYLYNKIGEKIRSLKDQEIQEFTNTDDYTLISDSRTYTANMYHGEYPYTVVFEYQILVENLFFHPLWIPLNNFNTSLQYAKLTVDQSKNNTYQYHTNHFFRNPKPSTGNQLLVWELHEISGIKQELFMPDYHEVFPVLRMKTHAVALGKYTGKTDSWKEIGQFFFELNHERDQLPNAYEIELLSQLANISDTLEKVRFLYGKLQENTRYTNISEDIGGWQTLTAEFVHKNKYGDCKALSNYMHAILSVAGIDSYHTLIHAGPGGIGVDPDFPVNAFNHMILMVPVNQDTLWLENTSQKNPFGYLGSFTEDRYALILKDQGSHLARTPQLSNSDNQMINTVKVDIYPDGSASGSWNQYLHGSQYEVVYQNFESKSHKEFLTWFYDHMNISSLLFDNLLVDTSSKEAKLGLSAIFTIKHFASGRGKRLFISPTFANQIDQVIPADHRVFPVHLRSNFIDYDTVTINMPEGYMLESIPTDSISFGNDFGDYSLKFSYREAVNQIQMARTFSMNKIQAPKEKYTELSDFLKKVTKADKSKIVLVEKQ